jgi:hypothetical protein
MRRRHEHALRCCHPHTRLQLPDVVTDDNGQMLYVFPRIAEELEAVARARRQASGTEKEAGAVVFSSKDSHV